MSPARDGIRSAAASAALLLIGAPGAGKSSVLSALMTLLELEGVEFGAIESEQLSTGSPPLPASQWVPQLHAILSLQQRAGRRLFIVVATTENAAELCAVERAVAAARVLVVCLTASPELVADRIAAREPDRWPGKQRLIDHARTLARTIPRLPRIDLAIDTGAAHEETVAQRVRDAMRAAGLL